MAKIMPLEILNLGFFYGWIKDPLGKVIPVDGSSPSGTRKNPLTFQSTWQCSENLNYPVIHGNMPYLPTLTSDLTPLNESKF